MELLDINYILNRKKEEMLLIKTLKNFEQNKQDITTKRGIYIYGSPGSGKTVFCEKNIRET